MEYIGVKTIMNRLLDNPTMRNLSEYSVLTYMKDFCSINSTGPIIQKNVFSYLPIKNYKAYIPKEAFNVRDVRLCSVSLDPIFAQDDKMPASLTSSKVLNRDKEAYGNYKIINGTEIECDVETGVLEIVHDAFRVDENGYPLIPYHGALMQSLLAYIKFQYYTILNENGLMADKFVVAADREYSWYLGVYLAAEDYTPTFDQAVSWAHSYQRLIDTGNNDTYSKSIQEFRNF